MTARIANAIPASCSRQLRSNAPPVRTAAALIAAASALALAGCVPSMGAGPMTADEREIDAVSTVVLNTSGDLSISSGEPRLVIYAPAGALDRLTSEAQNGTLILSTAPGPQIVMGRVRYELTLPHLQAVEVNGSGDVDATVSGDGTIDLDLGGSGDIRWTELEADRVEIRLAGSGDVDVAGVTTELEIEVGGSGNVDADDLEARAAVVSIAGSGDVDVSARDELSAEISGSGLVTYSGDPSVTADVSGSGEVVRK